MNFSWRHRTMPKTRCRDVAKTVQKLLEMFSNAILLSRLNLPWFYSDEKQGVVTGILLVA